MGRRRCPNCGKKTPDGVVCCPKCGHSVPVVPVERAPAHPLRLVSGGGGGGSPAEQADELGLLVAECPACGGQAQRGWRTCSRCRTPLPAGIWQRPVEDEDFDEDDPSDSGPSTLGAHRSGSRSEEYIDEPDVLEQAEQDVRRLPLRLPFTEPIKDPAAPATAEPAPRSWECPACGRQAQRGWRTCPWCRAALPAYVWKTDRDDPGG